MAIADVGNGSQTAVIGTEHVLATITTGKTCVLTVDLVNLAAGDTLELRAKVKVLTGSTAKEAYLETFVGDQAQDVFLSIPIPAKWSVAFTLKQTVGTSRVFDFTVLTLD